MLLCPAPPKIFTSGAGRPARVRNPLVTAEPRFRRGSPAPPPGHRRGMGSLERVPVPCEGLAALSLALEDLVFRKRSSMISFKQHYQRPTAERRDRVEGDLAHFVFFCVPFLLKQNVALSLPKAYHSAFVLTLHYEHFQACRKLKEFSSEHFAFSFLLF